MMAVVAALSALAPAAADAKRRSLGERTLQAGMRGTDVRVLQDFLDRMGIRTSVDGHFGRGTRRSVRRWERSRGLRVDGRVTPGDARRLRAHVTSVQQAEPETAAAPAEKAVLAADGVTAVAPPSAPQAVKDIIAAGNEIATKPYKYGGGHGRWKDSGYDCSGSMSYALHGAGLLDEALDSSGFMSWGKAGKGRWVTTYAHGGHSYMMVAGLRFDTSGLSQDGSRWHDTKRSADGYTVRHPAGL
jgi:peptidoglycan hydrolase-like protein with peptidoglycan-binding domain